MVLIMGINDIRTTIRFQLCFNLGGQRLSMEWPIHQGCFLAAM